MKTLSLHHCPFVLVDSPNKRPMIQYIPRNMHTVFALLCFVVVIHWLIFPYPSGLLHWHCGNLTIAPVPAKQPWWIWINTSCEFIMNDCITTTKQSTTNPCAYFLGYTLRTTFPWHTVYMHYTYLGHLHVRALVCVCANIPVLLMCCVARFPTLFCCRTRFTSGIWRPSPNFVKVLVPLACQIMI